MLADRKIVEDRIKSAKYNNNLLKILSDRNKFVTINETNNNINFVENWKNLNYLYNYRPDENNSEE